MTTPVLEKTTTVYAPAKINLFLEIQNKLDDGYHQINSIAIPISLYDKLEFHLSDKVSFSCNSRFTGPSSNNLVYKTVKMLRRLAFQKGINIKLEKRVPVGAGLGGGSSDAAATLKTLNRLWKLSLFKTELTEFAKKLGADVNLFLEKGPVLIRGIGELVTPINWKLGRLHIVIVTPDIRLLTRNVYENVIVPTNIDKRSSAAIIEGIKSGRIELMKNNIFNRLQGFAFALAPKLRDLHERLNTITKENFFLSGSGSSFFTICENYQNAESIVEKLKNIDGISIYQATTIETSE